MICVFLFTFSILCGGGVSADEASMYESAQVVWPEPSNGSLDIYYSRQTMTGWASKVRLSESADTDMMPCVCSDRDNARWVVWTADSGKKSDLFYVYARQGRWSAPKKIDTGLLHNASPAILCDESGGPWLVWAGNNGGGSDIFFSRWNRFGWEKASRVNRADSMPDIMPIIGKDSGGNPWVCWFGLDGDRYRCFSSTWMNGRWEDEVESDSDNLFDAAIDKDAEGEMPALPSFITDPDRAGIYVPGKGRVNAIPMRYLGLGSLLETTSPSFSHGAVDFASAPAGELLILGFGDSITQGVPYILDHGDGRRVGGYEPTLETLLLADSRRGNVYNWGVAGEKTFQGINRINTVLMDPLTYPHTDYILILEGTNDYFHMGYEDTIVNLGKMIDMSRAKEVTPILATLTPDTKTPQKQIDQTYNPAIKDLAAEKGVILADQYAALIEGWASSYNYDGLHPNEAGYVVMAQTWFGAIPEGPGVTTGGATSIGFTSAQLTGEVNPNGSATTFQFEYGTTTSYGNKTESTSAGAGTTSVSVQALVTGLADNTLYHYRLRATNNGGTVFGEDRSFTTDHAELPVVTTGGATSIGFTSAQLNGEVNPNGSATIYQFEYGTTTSYGNETESTSAGSGTDTLTVHASVTGLVNETLYHYRLVATNTGGTALGDDRTFTTHRPDCEGCYGDEIVLENVTYESGVDCECIAGTSITIGANVIIESGAHVTFTAPKVVVTSGFEAQSGALVEITVP